MNDDAIKMANMKNRNYKIKNIIFDIGGIMFDDSKDNINKVLNINSENLYHKVYGKNFMQCILGKSEVSDYIESFKNDKDYEIIKYILSKENLHISYPLMKENFEYISKLKDKGYNLYLLSNITKDSYEYVNETININKIFYGGVYSYQEKIAKPDIKIFDLIIKKFNLNKDETIFFDDKIRNVDSANSYGIKSFLFKSIKDIEDNI